MTAVGAGALTSVRSAPAPIVRMPIGSLDAAVGAADGSVTVAGWTIDPDTAAPTRVVVASEGSFAVAVADTIRPDVGRIYPFHGAAHGYTAVLGGLSTGLHQVCVFGVNIGPGFPFALLGCRVVLTGPTDPFGSLDVVGLASFDTVVASGWVADPQMPFPIEARLMIDGRTVAQASAAAPRPDVAAAFPYSGALHGFGLYASISPGRHNVCVVGINVGLGNDAVLGCRVLDVPAVVPFGSLDSVVFGDGQLLVGGWAVDPDAPGSVQIRVDVRADPLAVPVSRVLTADRARPDVAAALGVSAFAGYYGTVGAAASGQVYVCATALNRNVGRDTPLGCRTLSVGDSRPFGSVDAVVPVTGGFVVAGWAADRDSAAAVDVAVAVDGVQRVTSAARSRPDVGAAFPDLGSLHGFEMSWTGLGTGVHSVCVTFTDKVGVGAGVVGDRSMPCGTVIVGPTSVGTTGAANSQAPVAPAAGTPLADIDRDGGVSTRLSDGSTLWLFGDSSASNADGSLRYFVNNTAAWAPPLQPTTSRDAAANGMPIPFVQPSASFGSCSRTGARQIMWPLSAVSVPAGGRDRVIAYFENICLGPGTDTESRGVAVVEWWYDPAQPPDQRPIVATVLNQQLTTDRTIGSAAVLGDDGFIYSYACDAPPGGGWPADYGPCRAARVSPADVADRTAYQSLGTMVAPPGPAGQNLPVSSFSVVRDEPHGVYLMAYSPWPGFTDRVVVRVSTRPTGPWTPPIEIELPGCRNQPGDVGYYCYAGTAQPQMSTPSVLGIGYYDQLVAIDPVRGQYRVVTVPFVVGLG